MTWTISAGWVLGLTAALYVPSLAFCAWLVRESGRARIAGTGL